jgi:pyruvate/2-oxoglutarate dehydrogenase complex dihydrolipoamide acyltransferase (E2) component
MTIEVKLPQFGMGMQSGTIVGWLKAEGDRVQAGEPIAEVEAEKATSEVTAPAAGILSKILVSVDETVPVYSVIAHIDSP